jgi:hypothetical protein
VIIEDDEFDGTDNEVEVETETDTATGADVGSGRAARETSLRNRSILNPASESSAPVDTFGDNRWYDVEEERYVDEDEPLHSRNLGEQEGPTTCPTRDEPLPYDRYSRPSADNVDQHKGDRITQSSSTDPVAHTEPEPAVQESDGWNGDVAAVGPENEVDLFCEDRDGLSVASLSYSSRSPRRSIELLPHLNSRQSQSDIAHRRSEEQQDARAITHTPDVNKEKSMQQDTEAVTEEPGEKQQEDEEEEEMAAAVEVRAVQEEKDEPDEQAVEESQEGQGVGNIDNSEDEDYNRDTDDEDEEEDEDFRPAKRRKLPPVSAKEALEAARERNLKLDIGRPCRRTSPTFIQIEMDDRHTQTEDRDTLPPSRSPSAIAEVLAAEYEEWPLHGFLKRTRIGSTLLFNLEFHLTHVPEHLEPSGLSEALRSSIKSSALHQTSHSAVARSKTRHVKSRHPTKRILWTKEEDETLVKMKEEDGCSWEEISDALPSRTLAAIQVRYSTKLGGGTGSRKRRRP